MNNYHGPLLDARGDPIRAFATTNPENELVEVELRAGRNGVVFVAPFGVLDPGIGPELPQNETMRPVLPEARTTPFNIDDFGPPEPEMTEEERVEMERLIAADRLADLHGDAPPGD